MGLELFKIQLLAWWASPIIMRYAAAAPLRAITGHFRRLRQQASLDDVIKEVRDQLRKSGKSLIADLPDFKGLEVSVAECLKAEVELKGRVEALESGALQPSYVKNTEAGVYHSVVDGSDRTSCGWDFGRATKITFHLFWIPRRT